MASSASSSGRPVIGLTTYLEQAKTGVWDVPAAFLPKAYFDAVNRAGGIAVLIPPQAIDAGDAAIQGRQRLLGDEQRGGRDHEGDRHRDRHSVEDRAAGEGEVVLDL